MPPELSSGPRCGNCGAYFSPGQEVCSACGAHRYSGLQPAVGPLAHPVPLAQRVLWWGLAGVGVVLCGLLSLVFGLLDALLRVLPH